MPPLGYDVVNDDEARHRCRYLSALSALKSVHARWKRDNGLLHGQSRRRRQAASPALARLLRDDVVATYGAALPSALSPIVVPRRRQQPDADQPRDDQDEDDQDPDQADIKRVHDCGVAHLRQR